MNGDPLSIEGVAVKSLTVHEDERGRLMELLRRDDGIFREFGQVYMSTLRPGVVKAWHRHRLQDDYLTVVGGEARLVLFDGREGSPTRGAIDEFELGTKNPVLVRVPAGVYHGVANTGEEEAMVINVPTVPYDGGNPDEERLDPHDNDIPYTWPETGSRRAP